MSKYKRIGELLLSRGLLSDDQLRQALVRGHETRRRIGEVVVEMGFVEEARVTECLAEQYGYEIADPCTIHIEAEALSALDAEYALAHLILPIRNREDSLECIIADPIDIEATDFLSVVTQRNLVVYLAPPSILEAVIQTAYDTSATHRPQCVPPTRSRTVKNSSLQPDRDAILSAIRSPDNGSKKGFFAQLNGSSYDQKKAA